MSNKLIKPLPEVKQCPFCGSRVDYMNLFTSVAMFYCSNHQGCGAVISFDNPVCNHGDDRAKINAFNRRVPDDKPT